MPKCSRTCSTYPSAASFATSTEPPPAGGVSSSASIASSSASDSLWPSASKSLTPLYSGRVVRGGEDDPQVLGEQRDGGCRQHTAENGDPAPGDDAPDERVLERRARSHGVAADEDAAAAGPDRPRAPELLDEVERQRAADDAAHAISSEVSTGHDVVRPKAKRRRPGGRATPYGRRVIAWRTAAPCAPCASRPSCALPDARLA